MIGDKLSDLDHGKALQHDGMVVFKTRTICKLTRDALRNVSNRTLCRALRDAGFESRTVRLDGRVVRVWAKPAAENHEPEGSEA